MRQIAVTSVVAAGLLLAGAPLAARQAPVRS
jgi:hypothetical protein